MSRMPYRNFQTSNDSLSATESEPVPCALCPVLYGMRSTEERKAADPDTQTHRHTYLKTHRHPDTQTPRHTDTQTWVCFAVPVPRPAPELGSVSASVPMPVHLCQCACLGQGAVVRV
jgi:hypothetical protein